ncbi:hypothetical protein [Pseudomonas sp. PS02288]|uniref:hypothetical protein n=1 Tax=Pseudomonas sp. PS02288 TaxID=2991443 RepID=UPI00249CBE40|nr:hypothetical protein [Pseudomonas sp. PS02288]
MSLLAELFQQLDESHRHHRLQQNTALPDQLNTCASAVVANASAKEIEEPCQPDFATQATRRAAWRITLGGETICSMVGTPTTYSDALAAVRWRWPAANILETP